MKRIVVFSLLPLFVMAFAACSPSPSPMENDLREIASYHCKLRQLILTSKEPEDEIAAEVDKLQQELDKLTDAFEKKWGKPENDKELLDKMIQIMDKEKCK